MPYLYLLNWARDYAYLQACYSCIYVCVCFDGGG